MFTATSVSALTEYVYNADGQLDYQYNYKSNTKVEYKRNDNGSLVNQIVKQNAVVPTNNRLVDGNFEQYLKNSKGWTPHHWGATAIEIQPFRQGEDKGLTIQCSEMKVNYYCGVGQSISVQPKQPYVYYASLDIQKLAGAHVQLYVDFYNKQGQWVVANYWEKGIHESNGDWVYTVNFRNHSNEAGRYITHVYAVDKNENMEMISSTEVIAEQSVKLKNSVRLDEQWYDIYVYGVDRAAKKVQLPTWTAFQDQDDIKWIEGVKISDGVWRGRVKLSDYRNMTGSYVTHIYIDDVFFQGHVVEVKR
ncbi:GBS Bsp-like repeat-containing protein [Paenibacillus assamensis]|uniref:GBS Bsp-like repeat-containing protein n=1 Tax=Paenibacillus assamensis TaxID=311244 RepID=UPI00040E68F6|nr:GBS Bsp-like repeat-containing protein [Paenibacillus assamensis]